MMMGSGPLRPYPTTAQKWTGSGDQPCQRRKGTEGGGPEGARTRAGGRASGMPPPPLLLLLLLLQTMTMMPATRRRKLAPVRGPPPLQALPVQGMNSGRETG